MRKEKGKRKALNEQTQCCAHLRDTIVNIVEPTSWNSVRLLDVHIFLYAVASRQRRKSKLMLEDCANEKASDWS